MLSARVSVLLVALAGCGGGSSKLSAPTADPGAPLTTAQVLGIFGRSCAPCHRHAGGEPAAVANGAFLETESDIRTAMSSYSVGLAGHGLDSLLGRIEKNGELRVGPGGEARVLMPPAGSGVPPITPSEARAIHEWVVRSWAQ